MKTYSLKKENIIKFFEKLQEKGFLKDFTTNDFFLCVKKDPDLLRIIFAYEPLHEDLTDPYDKLFNKNENFDIYEDIDFEFEEEDYERFKETVNNEKNNSNFIEDFNFDITANDCQFIKELISNQLKALGEVVTVPSIMDTLFKCPSFIYKTKEKDLEGFIDGFIDYLSLNYYGNYIPHPIAEIKKYKEAITIIETEIKNRKHILFVV